MSEKNVNKDIAGAKVTPASGNADNPVYQTSPEDQAKADAAAAEAAKVADAEKAKADKAADKAAAKAIADQAKADAKAAKAAKGSPSVYKVKSPFRDKDDFAKRYDVGTDVSHFDKERLTGLEALGLVTTD